MTGRRKLLILMLAGAGLVAGAAVLSAIVISDWRLKAVAAGGGAVALFAAGVLQNAINAALGTGDKDHVAPARNTLLPGQKPPLVRDITDPVMTGVHAAARRPGGDRVPPYVPRDVDPVVHQALGRGGFVLLSGAAAAGKTRTGYEAIRAVLPRHVFIWPQRIDDVPQALKLAREERECVLWLDSLQRYLGGGAITSASITELLTGRDHHRVVVATLRAAEESRLIAMAGSLSGGQLIRDGQAVLDLAERIVVDRMFSAQERARAASLASQDLRLSAALRHADRYGLAEYLSSGPQLHTEWQNAWDRGVNPRGAALVAAAVDCRLAGFSAPLPRLLLEELHQEYLDRHDGMRLRPEPLSAAWAWATRLRDSGDSPLWLAGQDSYDVFDYLVDVRASELATPVPESTGRAALRFANGTAALVIGGTAWYQGYLELAVEGFRRSYAELERTDGPEALSTLTSRSDLAVALHASGKLPDAEKEYRAILDGRTAALGEAHPDTLASRNNLATLLHAQRRLDEAEAEYRAVLDLRTSTLGASYPGTLVTRNNLGVVLKDLGRLDEAEAELKDVVERREQVLGPDHPHTLLSRRNLAVVRRQRSGG